MSIASMNQEDLEPAMQRLDALLADLEHSGNAAEHERTAEIVRTLLSVQGAALKRILAYLGQAGTPGQAVLDALTADELVGHLLLLHDLHPKGLEARVRQALTSVQTHLEAHGSRVEFLRVTPGGGVHLRMTGSCGCPSSRAGLENSIKDTLYAAVPDITDIELEESAGAPAANQKAFVPLTELRIDRRPVASVSST